MPCPLLSAPPLALHDRRARAANPMPQVWPHPSLHETRPVRSLSAPRPAARPPYHRRARTISTVGPASNATATHSFCTRQTAKKTRPSAAPAASHPRTKGPRLPTPSPETGIVRLRADTATSGSIPPAPPQGQAQPLTYARNTLRHGAKSGHAPSAQTWPKFNASGIPRTGPAMTRLRSARWPPASLLGSPSVKISLTRAAKPLKTFDLKIVPRWDSPKRSGPPQGGPGSFPARSQAEVPPGIRRTCPG